MASKRRKGRPRKTGPRHKNGHLKRTADPTDSPRAIASRMPHRRGLGEQALDPAAESELGRMRLRGEVSEPEETAGYVYARMWRGYVATLSAPRAPGVAQGAISACMGCPSPLDRKWCICDLRRRIYAEAASVLVQTGSGVSPVVHAVVILDRQCPFSSLELLKMGLTALAKHYGLLTITGNRAYQKQRSEIVAPAK
jgi:hypothetical protein